MVRMPAASSAVWVAWPTPQMMRTGLGFRKASVSALPMTEKPRGLSRSEAILARNLLWRKADGAGEAQLVLHPFGQARQQDGGRVRRAGVRCR